MGVPCGLYAGLVFFGMGSGLCEIALNIEDAAIEEVTGHPVPPTLQGFFSLGAVVGSLIGLGLTAIDFPASWHLAGAALLMMGMALWAILGVPFRQGIIVDNMDATGRINGSESLYGVIRTLS